MVLISVATAARYFNAARTSGISPAYARRSYSRPTPQHRLNSLAFISSPRVADVSVEYITSRRSPYSSTQQLYAVVDADDLYDRDDDDDDVEFAYSSVPTREVRGYTGNGRQIIYRKPIIY